MGKKSVEKKEEPSDMPMVLEPKAKEEKKAGGSGKLEFPSEPKKADETAMKAKQDVLEEEIKKLLEDKKKLEEKIDEKSVGKEEYDDKKKDLQSAFEKAKEVFDAHRADLYKLTDEVKRTREVGNSNKKELRALEGDIKNMDEAAVDKKIKELEFKMHTSSMSLNDEKKCMKEISELKKKRPEIQRKARQLAALKDSISGTDDKSAPIEEQIQEVKKKIEEAKGDKDKKFETLNKLRDSRSEQTKDVKELIVKRNGIRDKVKAAKDQKWELQSEFNAADKEHRLWVKKCNDIKWAAQREKEDREWDAWNAEKKKASLEKQMEKPYFEEMTLLEQTIVYCKGLIGDLGDKKDEKEEKKEFEAPEGAMVMLKKSDRDDDGAFMAGFKGKKGKKKGPQGGEKKAKNIKHNAGTFSLFAQVKVSAPMTTDEVPATITKLEAEMEVYNAKILEWEEKRKDLEAEIKEQEEKIKIVADAAAKDKKEKKAADETTAEPDE